MSDQSEPGSEVVEETTTTTTEETEVTVPDPEEAHEALRTETEPEVTETTTTVVEETKESD